MKKFDRKEILLKMNQITLRLKEYAALASQDVSQQVRNSLNDKAQPLVEEYNFLCAWLEYEENEKIKYFSSNKSSEDESLNSNRGFQESFN